MPYRNFGLQIMTLEDMYPSGKETPLCSRYDSRTEACLLASATYNKKKNLNLDTKKSIRCLL